MKIVFYRVLAFLYSILIFYLSSLPNPPNPLAFQFSDKIIHFFEFSFLGYLFFNSLPDFDEYLPIILAIGYAGLDEIHQYFVPGRYCDWTDFLADSLGIIVTVLMFKRYNENTHQK